MTANKEDDKKKGISSEDKLLEDTGVYRRMVGTFLYLTVTRPDISFAGQAGLGILLSSKPSKKIIVLCDADWAAGPNTRRSVSGFLIKYGDSLISWKSKN
ncbi:uncharacterized mitochondrial protein AtMg00240-like [Lycium barbarum]|uniref:uncharacterized mitochondrial protein AtMg00240-like n=1 Tax=Lycium barbarum TaxID=112863 RepID=UPI00293E5A54|nr:uncharacterized mitochondrial protein AtMg00240-like [Lycium barbarum]